METIATSGEFKKKAQLLIDTIFESAVGRDGIKTVETESPETYPLRCRVVIVDADAQNVVVIRRNRPDQEPYAVFPGGGLEPEDETPLAGAYRELKEELSISVDSLTFESNRVVELTDDNQWVYFATAQPGSLETLTMAGPEATRDPAVSGTYEPTWVALSDIAQENVVPTLLRDLMQDSYAEEISCIVIE